MYGLMFVLPLVGWGMLSAAGYPIVLYGPCVCRSFFRRVPRCIRCCGRHSTVLAYLFFLTFLAHFAAILFHTLGPAGRES